MKSNINISKTESLLRKEARQNENEIECSSLDCSKNRDGVCTLTGEQRRKKIDKVLDNIKATGEK